MIHVLFYKVRLILSSILLVIVAPSYGVAMDPPMLSEYKNKILANLPAAYSAIDEMWGAYFPTGTPGEVPLADLPRLNKSAVYYDGAKVLHELAELFEGDASNQPALYLYRNKVNDIFHEVYTRATNPGGYVRFPHGLFYEYQETEDTAVRDAIVALAITSNWKSINPANEWLAYSREVAYAIHVYITAEKAGVSVEDNTAILNHFVDMALSHLNQWHTGTFWRQDRTNGRQRQAFMVGLTMNALIEYYERVNEDPRIPLAIKYSIDDLWNQQYQADVHNPTPPDGNYGGYEAGYGAFWYWADWNGSTWINRPNAMPSSLDLNADSNMIVGVPYAWYANYSNNVTYMDRAVDIWEGYVVNGFFGYADILWQGNRYVSNFIRLHRKFYNTPCSNSTIEQCAYQPTCEGAGGNWTGEICQHGEVSYIITSNTVLPPKNLRIVD